jgi:hypothetical protein
MKEVELAQPEIVLTMLEDVWLYANGSRDIELMKFSGLVEKVAALRNSFAKTNPPSAVSEVASYLRDTLELYVQFDKFIFDQERVRHEANLLPKDVKVGRVLLAFPTRDAIFNHLHTIRSFLQSDTHHFDSLHCFTTLCIHNLLYLLTVARHTYFEAPMAVHDIQKLEAFYERKKSTAKARNAKQTEAQSTHENIIRIFNELKREDPKISKHKASLVIGNIGKINQTPQVIRKHLVGV